MDDDFSVISTVLLAETKAIELFHEDRLRVIDPVRYCWPIMRALLLLRSRDEELGR
jgi:hypothetical protein